jgi:probable F420-dependent oxidoreductase
MQLGKIGVWATKHSLGEGNVVAAAQLAEELGYGTFWLGGSPKLAEVRPLLEATSTIVLATGIVNVWQNEPAQLAAEHEELARAFPERLLVGIGIGHPEATSDYKHPLSSMRRFLDGLDAATPPLAPADRCLAALGPKMLELSAERSLGAFPYFTPAAHTRFARERIGADALLATELACALDADPTGARAKASGYAKLYLGLGNYTGNLERFGFTEQDFADGGSDRLLDAVVPQGSAEQIAAVVHEHFAAGADHVCLQPVGSHGIPREEWASLAAALIA